MGLIIDPKLLKSLQHWSVSKKKKERKEDGCHKGRWRKRPKETLRSTVMKEVKGRGISQKMTAIEVAYEAEWRSLESSLCAIIWVGKAVYFQIYKVFSSSNSPSWHSVAWHVGNHLGGGHTYHLSKSYHHKHQNQWALDSHNLCVLSC